jgi:Chondroitin N-acetylgalactosaminyltransferase
MQQGIPAMFDNPLKAPPQPHSEDPLLPKFNVLKSLQRCGRLFLAFLLLGSLRNYFFPAEYSNSLASPSSLRVQSTQHRRLLQAQPNNAIHQFDIMVPVFERDDNLREFATRLKPSLEEYTRLTAQNLTRITTFRLLTTRYEQEKESSTQLQQELSQLTGLPLDQIVMVPAPDGVSFSRSHAVNLMLDVACKEPYCLVSRMDVDMLVKPSFFLNSERDVISGQTVYFPIVWSAYHPKSPDLAQFLLDVQALREKTRKRVEMPPHSEHRGHWRKWGTGMWTIGGPDAQTFRFNEEFKGTYVRRGVDRAMHAV